MTIKTPEDVMKEIENSDTYKGGVRNKRREIEENLTKLQKRFAFEYVKSHHGTTKTATQCYIDAGGTPKSARTQASKLVNNVHIQEYINVLMNDMIQGTSLDYNEVVQNAREIMEQARTNDNLKIMLDCNKHLAELLKLKWHVDETKKKLEGLDEDSSDGKTVSSITQHDTREERVSRMKNILTSTKAIKSPKDSSKNNPKGNSKVAKKTAKDVEEVN